jgi:hypothetical protein
MVIMTKSMMPILINDINLDPRALDERHAYEVSLIVANDSNEQIMLLPVTSSILSLYFIKMVKTTII